MDVSLQPLPIDPLHQLAATSLGGDGVTMEPAWAMALEANFGSVERWREDFVACAKAPGGGSGWVLLVFRPREGTLVNLWAADAAQAAAGGVPILALDLHPHAYPGDAGAAAGAYVDAFIARIDWAGVYARYQAAVHEASEPFAAAHDDVPGKLLLDVRRAGVYAKASQLIEGARWCDPVQVALWSRELPPRREVVVYCVYGHEVGRATALRLRAAGVDARFLRGGIEDWTAAGRPLADKAPRP
jgi:superoxide dismutase, Fe-Mn family